MHELLDIVSHLLALFTQLLYELDFLHLVDTRLVYDLTSLGAAVTFYLVSKSFTTEINGQKIAAFHHSAKGFKLLAMSFILPNIIWRLAEFTMILPYEILIPCQALLYAALVACAARSIYIGATMKISQNELNSMTAKKPFGT